MNLSLAFFIHSSRTHRSLLLDGDFLKNSYTKFSDQGLVALGSLLKDLKSLTNLSFDLQYFLNITLAFSNAFVHSFYFCSGNALN